MSQSQEFAPKGKNATYNYPQNQYKVWVFGLKECSTMLRGREEAGIQKQTVQREQLLRLRWVGLPFLSAQTSSPSSPSPTHVKIWELAKDVVVFLRSLRTHFSSLFCHKSDWWWGSWEAEKNFSQKTWARQVWEGKSPMNFAIRDRKVKYLEVLVKAGISAVDIDWAELGN